MSWLGVFISAFIPVVLLAILMAVDWLEREVRSKPSPLKVYARAEKRIRDGLADKQSAA